MAPAVCDYLLWGALDVDAHSVMELCMLNGDDGALERRVEGNLGENWASAILPVMHGDLRGLQPFDEGDIGAVADWDVE